MGKIGQRLTPWGRNVLPLVNSVMIRYVLEQVMEMFMYIIYMDLN